MLLCVLKRIKQGSGRCRCFQRQTGLCSISKRLIFATVLNSEKGQQVEEVQGGLHQNGLGSSQTAYFVAREHCRMCVLQRSRSVLPSPESRVSPRPPEWAPGVRSYAPPFFPGPERSTEAGPSHSNATRRPGTDWGGCPDLHAVEQRLYSACKCHGRASAIRAAEECTSRFKKKNNNTQFGMDRKYPHFQKWKKWDQTILQMWHLTVSH